MSEAIAIKASQLAPPDANRADVWSCFRHDLDKLLDRVEATLDLPSLRGHVEHLWPQASQSTRPFQVRAAENETAFVIDVMLPGVQAKDIEVTLGCDHVEVKLRADGDCAKAARRSFALPDNVRRGAVAANFHDGVLSITLPKARADNAPRKIAVDAVP
jgi:HSP20 family molecular chaperone IbpA